MTVLYREQMNSPFGKIREFEKNRTYLVSLYRYLYFPRTIVVIPLIIDFDLDIECFDRDIFLQLLKIPYIGETSCFHEWAMAFSSAKTVK